VAGSEAAFLWEMIPDAGDGGRIKAAPISHMTFDADAKITSMRAFFLPKTLRSYRRPRTTSRSSESHAGIWGGDAPASAKRPPLLAFTTSRVVPTAAPPPACVGLAAARDDEQSNPVGPHHNVPESPSCPEQYAVTREVLMLGGSDLDLPDADTMARWSTTTPL
jgi:hypothetical protein